MVDRRPVLDVSPACYVDFYMLMAEDDRAPIAEYNWRHDRSHTGRSWKWPDDEDHAMSFAPGYWWSTR